MICLGCGAPDDQGCYRNCPEVSRIVRTEAELDRLFKAAQAKINLLYERAKAKLVESD